MSRPPRLRIGHSGAIAGFDVGILCLNTVHPLVPGNVQHSGSFDFPVLYGCVEDVSISDLMAGTANALPPIVAAAKRLEQSGVRVIAGACGSFANYQKPIAAELKVPVCMSILTQVPFLLSLLPKSQKLGIIFASTKSFTPKVKEQCGISETDASRIVAAGAEELNAFEPLLAQRNELDSDVLEREVAEMAADVRQRHPEIGAWVLQCSDLPPYAAAIQQVTGLPVFDMRTLIEHLHRAVAHNCFLP